MPQKVPCLDAATPADLQAPDHQPASSVRAGELRVDPGLAPARGDQRHTGDGSRSSPGAAIAAQRADERGIHRELGSVVQREPVHADLEAAAISWGQDP